MKKTIIFLALTLLLGACGTKDEGQRAARVAKVQYENLLHGKYAEFVDGTLREEPIPATYRDQLILAAEQYMENQQKEHQGIKSIDIKNAVLGDSAQTANVFLLFTYGDGGTEQVVVPMVKSGKDWFLR